MDFNATSNDLSAISESGTGVHGMVVGLEEWKRKLEGTWYLL